MASARVQLRDVAGFWSALASVVSNARAPRDALRAARAGSRLAIKAKHPSETHAYRSASAQQYAHTTQVRRPQKSLLTLRLTGWLHSANTRLAMPLCAANAMFGGSGD
jgi:hypothetical protein